MLNVDGVNVLNSHKNKAQMLIQLKVDDALPGLFEYCEARVPFSGRGRILDVEATPGMGTVMIEDDGTDVAIYRTMRCYL